MSNQKELESVAESADDESQVVLTATGVGKTYYGVTEGGTRNDAFNDLVTLFRQLLRPRKEGGEGYRGLSDVSFSLNRGTILGLIGANGSGKSTLLKVLAGVTQPSSGRIVISGRVVSLIELGLGFDEDRTGRENILMGAALYDLDRARAEERIDAIAEFAGIGQFLDMPVRTYSSGMSLRLSFATAIHMDPDIILADEVLAVGDIGFRRKSLDYLRALKEQGKSIIYVSHDLGEMSQIADEVLWLANGKVAGRGKAEDVIAAYEAAVFGAKPELPPMLLPSPDPDAPAATTPRMPARLERLTIVGSRRLTHDSNRIEVPLDTNAFELFISLLEDVEALFPFVDIVSDGTVLATLSGNDWINVLGHRIFVHIPIEPNLLNPGVYVARAAVDLRIGEAVRRMDLAEVTFTAWRRPQSEPRPYILHHSGTGKLNPLFINRQDWTVRQWIGDAGPREIFGHSEPVAPDGPISREGA